MSVLGETLIAHCTLPLLPDRVLRAEVPGRAESDESEHRPAVFELLPKRKLNSKYVCTLRTLSSSYLAVWAGTRCGIKEVTTASLSQFQAAGREMD